MYRHKKHLFFDMDDTVTPSRTPMEDELYEFYASLPHDIIVVSGAQVSQIDIQVRNLPVYRLGQNGNQAINPENTHLWNETLSEEHTRHIHEHVQKVRALHAIPVADENDLVEHRGAQMSYSLIGHNQPLEHKKMCDPERKVRLSLLEQVPFESDELEVKIGGTTCFDYFQKGKHKGFNVNRLIEHMGWNKDECIYFGDAIFPGGNDETVIGVIDTYPVQHHLHTYQVLREHFIK
jgi:phosphomannomutase